MSEEIKKNAEELADETVEQATGGAGSTQNQVVCPRCQHVYYKNPVQPGCMATTPPCPNCGYDRYADRGGKPPVPERF